MPTRKISFATILKPTGKTTTGIVVPREELARLSSAARPAVVAKVNDYSYRTTVGIMNGVAMLPFSAHHRLASGISGHDKIEVELALDLEPRTVELPDDLASALSSSASAKAAFFKQAPSRQKADAANVAGAKSREVRARRIAAIVAKLVQRA